jgi:hypothetical protein
LQNYYQILGLANFAGAGEIKNAFRRLAKLYHPDINPSGQEYFKGIVKAYEILSDPYQKSQYDYKLKFQLNQAYQKATSPTQKQQAKSQEASEQELKRRQYYQEHYKKHYQQSQATVTEEPKRTNNEFRNILVATPIAVLLIMLILNVWNNKPEYAIVKYEEKFQKPKPKEEPTRKRVITGDTPYMDYFGGAKNDTIAKRSMRFKNMSGSDMIVFLFASNKFLRSCYVEHGYEVTIDQLPKEINTIRVMQGTNFEYIKELPKAGVYGAFVKDCKFYQYSKKVKLNGNNQLTLVNFIEQGFVEVKEEDFFIKNTGSKQI